MIENAKQAHAKGLAWVDLKINGGPVKLNVDSQGSIGRVSIKGAFTAREAMDIFKAATK